MQIKIKKKLLLILVAVFFFLLAGASLLLQWGGFDWLKNNKKVKQPILSDQEDSLALPEEKIETAKWEDPAGFSFSYNKELEFDKHPEDKVNYANLEFSFVGKKGIIKIIVNDSDYQDLDEWYENDKSVRKGSAIDTEVAGLKAKKVVVSQPISRVVTAFIDADQVIYLLQLDPEGEDRFWQRNYDLILSSMELIPLEGESGESLRLLEIEEDWGEGEEGEVIVEPVEVVE